MQKSTDGGDTFLPHRVRVDKPGQFEDNLDKGDVLPNKNFRAPNTISLAYSSVTGTLVYAYTNYNDQAQSGANIAVSLSHDGGMTWSDTKTVGTKADGISPAPKDQFFPWVAADPSDNFYRGVAAGDKTRQPQHRDVPGHVGRRRRDMAEHSDEHRRRGIPIWASLLRPVHRRLQRARRVRSGGLRGLDRRARHQHRRDGGRARPTSSRPCRSRPRTDEPTRRGAANRPPLAALVLTPDETETDPVIRTADAIRR